MCACVCVVIFLPSLSLAPAQEEAKPLGHPWRVVVAVCVQRLPNLARERADVEKRYEELKVAPGGKDGVVEPEVRVAPP